jgi:hypothetical protein
MSPDGVPEGIQAEEEAVGIQAEEEAVGLSSEGFAVQWWAFPSANQAVL